MSRRTLTAAPLALVLLTTASLARADRTWTVRSGDVLSVLAHRFGVTVDQLREWNDLEGDRIEVGQELVIRGEEEAAEGDAGEPGATYEVDHGDTLSGIAVRFDVTVDDLCYWNPELDPDHIREGQELRVGPALSRRVHTVRSGDTVARIAHRYGVRVHDVVRWNEGLDPQRIRVGQEVVVYSERPPSFSESVGAPHHGSLDNAVRLRPHRAYVIRDRDAAWGTEETVRWLREGFDAVVRAHARTPRVRVHDLSEREGGWMSGHRSHQSGRDADIAYYQTRCPRSGCPFRRFHPSNLDVERQWTLFRHWLEEGVVQAIFMDYRLQEVLYRHARSEGATRRELHRWFQHPRGRDFPLGIIRHYPNHHDHAHVRFRCPETDEECH